MKKTGIPKPAQATKKPDSTKNQEHVKKVSESPRALTTDWVELEKDLMICPGSYSQSHKRFKGHNEQGAAVCVVACLFASLKKPNTWTKNVLNQILEVGTNLHLKTRQMAENKCQTNVEPHQVYKYFFLDNYKISLRVGVDVATARIPRDVTIIDQVERFLRDFFKEHDAGVFACQQLYFAIWKFDKFYFLFDPRDHNPMGGKWMGLPGWGFCYALRGNKFRPIADTIIKNIPLKQINKFTIYPVVLEKVIKVNTEPPKTIEEATNPAPAPIPAAIPRRKIPVAKPKVAKEPTEASTEAPEPVEPSTTEAVPEGGDSKAEKAVPMSRIPPERPRLQSVTKFTEIQPTKLGILRASTHQCDPKFSRYQGAQGLSNAVAALTMLRQHKAKTWVRSILDDILKLGEVIHHDSKDLPFGKITNKITLKEKEYSPKLEKYGAIGRLQSDTDQVFSLQDALTNFLIDNDCCILIGPVIVAVWKEQNRYYMFDPNERDARGKLANEQPGVACVTWFAKIPDLVALYMENLPKHRQKDKFVLAKVTIKDFVPLAEDWYNFKALTFNRWILRGSFCQQDRRFPEESRNAQCTANATMALAYKELKPEQDWDSGLVDQMLVNGDEFYRGCIEYLKENNKFKDKYLMVDELKRSFEVENKRVNLEIDDCLVNGILNAKSDTGIPNLKKGFEEFFTGNDAGIVTANLQSMAVWRRDQTYYYYDSHSRNEKGVVCGHGTACVLRLVNIDDLAKALLTNLGADRQNFYNISRIVVRLMDLTEEGVVKAPLNSYEPVSDIVSILRSNFSETDKSKFNIAAGKQTIAMCLAALALNALIPAFNWDKEDLDEVLEIGNKLYDDSMAENYRQEVPEDEVTSDNVLKQLTIGTNSFDIEVEQLSEGNIEENLEEAIKDFYQFCQNDWGSFQALIESGYVTASIWRDENLIYLFDPKPRDEKGEVYGKDDWSVKEEDAEGEAEEEEEEQEDMDEDDEEEDAKKDDESDEDEENDEMGGGDNFGIRVSEMEQQKNEVHYDLEDHEEKNEEEKEDEEGKEEEDGEEGEEEEEEEEEEEAAAIPVVKEKKGSDYWRQQEENGKACVLRFSRIEDLIKHLVENSPQKARGDISFALKKIKIDNKPTKHTIHDPEEEKEDEIVGDWNEFKEVDYGRWILRCARNFNDPLFPECNRGKQQLSMCIVALGFVFLYQISEFKPSTLDDILAYGDRFYTTLRRLREKELKKNTEFALTDEEIEQVLRDADFRVNDYPRKLCMGEKLAKWEVNMEVVCGDISSKIPEEVPDLPTGLEVFFLDHTYGLLGCRGYHVAVWKLDDFFYMFDPHGTGPSGVKSPIGVACITRYKELGDLSRTFLNNLDKYGDNFFEIHAFSFEESPCPRERVPEPETTLPRKMGGYNMVTEGKYIIRGTAQQDYSNFDRGMHVYGAAIAVAALGIKMSTRHDCWTKNVVDEVLKVGEQLHYESVEALGNKFNPWKDTLRPDQVKTEFSTGALRVNGVFLEDAMKGIVDVKNNKKVLNLRQGIEAFFRQDADGVLSMDKMHVAIWEDCEDDKRFIYVYDPNPRGPTGLPSNGGVPCVMKFRNAKIAADHLMNCMLGYDKKTLPFKIMPVYLMVGHGCKKSGLSKTTRRKDSPMKKTVIGTSQMKSGQECILEEKRMLRALAEQKRRAEEARKLAELGRTEMYQVAPGQYIVRGLRCMLRNRDLPVNIAAFIWMQLSVDLNQWTYKDIELILETGQQLHVDSYNTYRPTVEKLNLTQVLRNIIFQGYEVRLEIRKPIICGLFTREKLYKMLDVFFTKTNFCMLSYIDDLVSIYFNSGYYYYFDPYSRDLNGNKTEKGCAMLMRFDKLDELSDKLLINLSIEQGVAPFALIVVAIKDILIR